MISYAPRKYCWNAEEEVNEPNNKDKTRNSCYKGEINHTVNNHNKKNR